MDTFGAKMYFSLFIRHQTGTHHNLTLCQYGIYAQTYSIYLIVLLRIFHENQQQRYDCFSETPKDYAIFSNDARRSSQWASYTIIPSLLIKTEVVPHQQMKYYLIKNV